MGVSFFDTNVLVYLASDDTAKADRAEAALHAGCDTLWSEDMRHGMVLDGGLLVVNPFRPAPA